MTEIYKFFNSTATDRRQYGAEDFAEFFEEFLSSGLIHRDGQPFMNVALGYDPSKYTVVSAGSAIMKGHLYKNTSDIHLTHLRASLPKIDRVVLRFDNTSENRFIKVFIKEGTPDVSPVPPSLTRNSEVYEISLAQVRISEVSSSDLVLVDERSNQDVCGMVDSMISIPVENLEADFNQFKDQVSQEFYQWFDNAIRQSNVELLEQELKLIKMNQIELLMQRYLDGKSTDMDAGYFYDVLSDWNKIDRDKTTALLDTTNMALKFPFGFTQVDTFWKPHEIGFITSKVKHYQTRPIQQMLTLSEDALAGQNIIKVENIILTITEVD